MPTDEKGTLPRQRGLTGITSVNKGRRILIALAVAISAASLTIALWPRNKEPEYGGKKLSEWLGPQYLGLDAVSDRDKSEAIEAVYKIGTNAIPCLVKWISYETPRPTQKLLRVLDRQPLGFLRRPLFEPEQRRHSLAVGAMLAFQILGSSAKPATPDLNRVMTNPGAFSSSHRAIEALKFIGHGALPYLLFAATNSHIATRDNVPQAIAYVARYENAPSAVGVLCRLLNDQDARVAEEAAKALVTLGVEPAVTVPALIKAAQDQRSNGLRWEAVTALGKFGAQVRPAIPVLVKCLNDQNVVVRFRAIQALRTLRLEPGLVVPALTRKSVDKQHPGEQVGAMEALATFGKAAESAVPVILPLLDDSHIELRRAATNALREIAPERLQGR